MSPIYYTNANNPLIEKYKDWFQKFRDSPDKPIELLVSKHNLKHEAITPIIEPLTVIQHFPDLLGRLALNVELKYERDASKGLYHKGYDWVTPKAIAWIHKLAVSFPAIIFFIKNTEEQMHSLIGDLFAKGKIPLRSLDKEMTRLYISPHHQEVIAKRMFQYSCFFYVFCLGTDFDPIETIKTVYKTPNIPCPIEMIIKASEKNILIGDPFGRSHLN
ncbi:hypothetical protein GCM10027566_22690 [Arachidicoccus ginsenosidivorans]|uniref:Uncharacterized protein n=1 Tax=Arachidicoccus ginsenosidivorans TaxID=496057 RepID=A0A5B8VJ58_9BACT|nr:hypothetical protein [Arachidicoccus ginsenosidivorans]QEC71213.1 hypothetical protein FSB73_05495 [Arachidicoccus ginsenosidivorans]